MISGDQAFKLHDTYGFPLDLTREIALENGLVVDEEGFKAEMQKQRVRAREAAKAKDASAWIRSGGSHEGGSHAGGSHAGGMPTEFTGYAQTESEAVIILIMKDGEPALNAEEGQAVTLLLDKTPFYGESGGQAGDTGTIIAAGGIVRIDGCRKTADGKFLHTGIVENGSIEQGETAIASIDVNRRRAIARNHTATHLLQKALRNILGQHVSQSGSLVESDRLRFDFTHPSPVTSEEIVRIEDEVNGRILDGIRVDIDEMPVAKAKELGATALFGEKYGDVVRVVKIGEYSMELCGGTHLESTSAAGLFKITTEGGVAAGIRRIEAVTGSGALDYLNGKARLLESAASLLKTIPADIEKKIESVNLRLKESDNEIRQLRGKIASFMIDGIIAAAPVIKGVKLVKARFDEFDGESLREAADRIKAKIGNGSGIVVLASSFDSKAGFIVAVTGDLASRGVNAGKIVGEVARAAGGGGGGRPDMAQAGAKDVSKIDQALALADEVVEAMLQSCNNK